jgi:hypothetical protein
MAVPLHTTVREHVPAPQGVERLREGRGRVWSLKDLNKTTKNSGHLPVYSI